FSFRKPVLSDSISGAANKASNQSAGIVLSVPAYPKRGSHHARLSGLCRWREFPGEPKLEEFFCETDTARRCAGGNDRDRGSDHRPLGPGCRHAGGAGGRATGRGAWRRARALDARRGWSGHAWLAGDDDAPYDDAPRPDGAV